MLNKKIFDKIELIHLRTNIIEFWNELFMQILACNVYNKIKQLESATNLRISFNQAFLLYRYDINIHRVLSQKNTKKNSNWCFKKLFIL